MKAREFVFDAISLERENQLDVWGFRGNNCSSSEYILFIEKKLNQAKDDSYFFNEESIELQMISIAALAVSYLENKRLNAVNSHP